ncbi:MAG: protease modulator HflC [Cardiobacteriaceae bacterium]|nr:protease modulator HflC [Cardiobacteriaceae bacterium]
MNNKLNTLIAVVVVALILLVSSAYIINERQIAVVTQFSRLISTDNKAGLKFKLPFVQNVELFDARIQRLDVDPERFMTNEKKWLIVDYFVEWRIKDIRTFYTSVQGNFEQASRLLDNMVKENLRGEFVQRSVKEAISQDRGTIMDAASKRISQQAEARYGMEVLGVRLKRVDFSDEIRDRVFDRMRAERERVSKDFRARGQEKSSVIRATAEREAAELLAKAREEADIMRGEADATAAKQYAQTYGADIEFYRYWRSLLTYRDSLNGSTLIVSPDSRYFSYLNGSEEKNMTTPQESSKPVSSQPEPVMTPIADPVIPPEAAAVQPITEPVQP